MSVLNLDVFPEIIAAFSFCPIGFALTFIVHYVDMGLPVTSELYDLIWGPYIVIVACAIISCIVMHTMKVVHQKYNFEHLYLVLVGLIFTLVAGISMFLYEEHLESRIILYVIAPGIGFVYVPGLAYIFARAKDYRHIKISLCHIFYFIGFMLGTVILSNYERKGRLKLLQVYGYVLTAIAIVAILLIIINEILQYRYKTYFNYKQSSEYNMDYENKFKTIFLKSYFKNASQNADLNLNNYKPNPFKIAGYVIYLIIIKLVGLVFFYYPLLYVNYRFISTDLYFCYLISIIGLVASTILLKFIKIKTNFLVSLILKIISFLVLILFINIYEMEDEALMIFYWIHMIFMLYGYNVSDIIILELTKLKYTEIVLTAGLILEFLINGTLHYFVITSPASIYNLTTMSRDLLDHIIPIVIVLLIILFITILVLPDTFNKSVLEIQNIMFFKTYHKKSNGSGTSIQQKEQPKEYGIRTPPNELVKRPTMDDDDQFNPSSRSRPQHVQTVSMSSSTATSEFNYRYNKPQDPPVVQIPPTPEEPYFDYSQIKPQPLFPRPRPMTNNFAPLNQS